MEEIERSEKDKQNMEKYYENKWNQEFNAVRSNLEKAYRKKTAIMEENFSKQEKELNIQMKLSQKDTERFRKRNRGR